MACSTPIIIKDFFMKTDQELYGEDKNKSSSGFEKVARTPDDQQRDISLRSMDEENNMSQSVWFFRKYLLTRSQNNVAKTSMEAEFESEISKGHSSPRPLPPKFLGSNNFPGHRLSLLEQQLLPGLRCDDQSNRTSEQLTIFYDGIINVYDNIPANKAQAIMRSASENSSVKPLVAERLKTDRQKPPLKPKSLSVSKIRAGLPMARRYSLQCFLEKRRGRNINNSPYALHSEKQEDNYEATVNNESNESNKLSLLPFPSSLGYFYPSWNSKKVIMHSYSRDILHKAQA
ncbi:protein TIFY 4B-like [Prunus dulcis]|uniref:protein TIFY 4B-like n=1 Tax=Prunus dulcis TaxID=3755 RepID=UPI001482C438|nr:protein TIFY 4B-like [Prunus dulcis]